MKMKSDGYVQISPIIFYREEEKWNKTTCSQKYASFYARKNKQVDSDIHISLRTLWKKD